MKIKVFKTEYVPDSVIDSICRSILKFINTQASLKLKKMLVPERRLNLLGNVEEKNRQLHIKKILH